MALLKPREVAPKSTQVNLVNRTTDLQAIAEAGSSQNEWVDLALNTAINFSDKLLEGKRKNELAEKEIAKQNILKKVESDWVGKDRFSEDNYAQYQSELNGALDEIDNLLTETKYAKKTDVTNWKLEAKKLKKDLEFQNKGKKAQYDIKLNMDKTMINFQGLMMNYSNASSEQEADKYLTQGLELLQTLDPFIEDGELEKMKFQALSDAQIGRTKSQVSKIISSSMSIEGKKEALDNIKRNISNPTVYKANAQELAKKGIISNDMVEAFASTSQEAVQKSLNEVGGYLNQLNNQIRTEKYQMERQERAETERALKQYKTDKLKLNDALQSKDFITAVNLIEDDVYTMDDILTSPVLSQKYLGKTPANILQEGGYIATMDRGTVNVLKEQKNTDYKNGVPRSTTVGSMLSNIYDIQDEDMRTNSTREFVDNGIVSNAEVALYEMGKSKTIDYLALGDKNSQLNNISISGISATNEMANNLRALPIENRTLAVQAIHGAVVDGTFGVLFEGGKKFTNMDLITAYKQNKDFREYVDETVSAFSNIDIMKFEKASMDRDKVYRAFDSKKSSVLRTRRKTQEIGTEPIVEETLNDELLGWD